MRNSKKIISTVLAAAIIAGTTLVSGGVTADAKTKTGTISWYNQTSKTASGKHAKNGAASHKYIPFNTKVKVKNNKNKKTTTVVIYDRMPDSNSRILDMNKDAFAKVEKTSAGLFNGTITWTE